MAPQLNPVIALQNNFVNRLSQQQQQIMDKTISPPDEAGSTGSSGINTGFSLRLSGSNMLGLVHPLDIERQKDCLLRHSQQQQKQQQTSQKSMQSVQEPPQRQAQNDDQSDEATPLPVSVIYNGKTVLLPYLSTPSLDETDKLCCTFKKHTTGVHSAERKLPYCYPVIVYSCKEHGKHVDERLRAAYNNGKVSQTLFYNTCIVVI